MRQPSEMVLGDLVRIRAATSPDLDVLTFEHMSGDGGPDEVRTYADLAANGNAIAAKLIDLGLSPGDRVALMMRNHPEFVETMVGASIAGVVLVPIDPRTRGEKLAFFLRDASCRGVVCASGALASVSDVLDDARTVEWVMVRGTAAEVSEVAGAGGAPEVTLMSEVLADADSVPEIPSRLETDNDPLQILYTSGTTGDPKGVMFPNSRFGLYAMLAYLLGYQPTDRPYTGLSLTHGNAQAVTLAPSLTMGLRAVFSPNFTKSRLWDICRKYGCTTFSLLGGMVTAIYAEPERPDDADNPVRMVCSAGMPAAIWEAFEKRFGVEVFEWYGAVEGGLAAKPIGQGPIGSFGKPVGGLEMLILDDDDAPCPPGVVGEICSRPSGGKAEVEYFENPEASQAKVRGGWLRSGDMGHIDEDGWFFFDYRKGGGLRHNGDFVHPAFVERVLAEHPDVTDVYVYGVTAASGAPGEKDVVAAVVPTDPESFDAASVFEGCRRSLEPNMVPTYLQVVEEIPKTASEKPQERFLLEMFDPDAGNVVVEQPRARSQR